MVSRHLRYCSSFAHSKGMTFTEMAEECKLYWSELEDCPMRIAKFLIVLLDLLIFNQSWPKDWYLLYTLYSLFLILRAGYLLILIKLPIRTFC